MKKNKDFTELSRMWFDKRAEVYDERDEVLYSKYGKISCGNIFDYLSDKEYDTLLDIGCGTGYLMLSKSRKAQYVGLDLPARMISVRP